MAFLDIPSIPAPSILGALLLVACTTPDGTSGSAPPPPSEDPRVVWRSPKLHAFTQPVLDDSTVYVLLVDGQVAAIDRRRHVVRWITASVGPYDEGDAGARSLFLLGDRVVVGMGNTIYAYPRAGPLSGSIPWVWGYIPASDATGVGSFGLATDGARVFTGSFSGHVVALDGATGAELWSQRVTSDDNTTIFNPAVDRDLLVVARRTFTAPATGEVIAFDAASGAIRWRVALTPELPGYDGGSVSGAVFYRDLFVVAHEDGRILALDRGTGTQRWASQALPADRQIGPIGQPSPRGDHRYLALSGQTLVASSITETLEGLDVETGRTLWRTPSPYGSVVAPPVASGGVVVAQFLGGQLAAFSLATGAVQWRFSGYVIYGEFAPIPAIQGDTLFAPGRSAVWALRLP